MTSKSSITRIKEKAYSLFAERSKEKTTVKKRPVFLTLIIFLIAMMGMNSFFSRKKEKSTIAHSSRPLLLEQSLKKDRRPRSMKKEAQRYFLKRKVQRKTKTVKKHLITYKKKQVFLRNEKDAIIIPPGKKIIAKLTGSIDTRTPLREISAIIPFPAIYKGKTIIPKNSILLGIFATDTRSDRIYIRFSKCILPNGKQLPINAQALDSKNYKEGIKGNLHSRASMRIAKSIAFGMVSPMAETLTQKEALGQGYTVTPKSTMKNAFLQGIARSSEGESKRQISEIGDDKDYLTLAAGKEIIVNLLTPFSGVKTNL